MLGQRFVFAGKRWNAQLSYKFLSKNAGIFNDDGFAWLRGDFTSLGIWTYMAKCERNN